MVLRYQMKSSVEEEAGSGSNGNFSEEMVDKFDEWTFVPESYVDSVFGQSDDLDSEGDSFKTIVPFMLKYIYIYIHTLWHGTMETETKT